MSSSPHRSTHQPDKDHTPGNGHDSYIIWYAKMDGDGIFYYLQCGLPYIHYCENTAKLKLFPSDGNLPQLSVYPVLRRHTPKHQIATYLPSLRKQLHAATKTKKDFCKYFGLPPRHAHVHPYHHRAKTNGHSPLLCPLLDRCYLPGSPFYPTHG